MIGSPELEHADQTIAMIHKFRIDTKCALMRKISAFHNSIHVAYQGLKLLKKAFVEERLMADIGLACVITCGGG